MSKTPPLFIVGAPRSGNTLTRRVLMASEQIYIPPETYVIGEILSRWRKWGRLDWRERVWLFCAYFERHPHFEDLEIESLNPFSEQACALARSQQTVHALIDLFYAFMTHEHGYTAARWGDKTPWNTVHLKHIVKTYPDAYYLYLKRDGRDVVASQMKSDMRDFENSAQRWIDANASCRRHLKRARRTHLEIAYEDLVTDPESVFRSIFAWADLEFAPEHLTKVPEKLGDVGRHAHHAAVTQPITARSIGKWQESLTADAFDHLPPAFSEMMQTLGYGTDSSGTAG
ncbi:MAG: sulfotransferase [Henriciella sp.]|nr:sulfotransferase [Henriciella sp.]